MNQNQIQQLTSHLSQALDQNYDVVNMEAVLSVICALEGTTITKEQLEATRLAKYINQLRRRTKNDQLARRAKSLLKKWREMVGINQQTSIDSQSKHMDQSTFKPMVETNLTGSESNATEADLNQIQYNSQPFSPTLQRVISNLHTNIDSSEPKLHHQTNFSSLINNNINIDNRDNRDESLTIVNKQIQYKPQNSSTITNEHSSNSVSSAFVANDNFNQASIVIDIVSDSDENDTVNSQKKLETESSLLATPSHYFRPKKLKKDKKYKDRDSRDKPLFNLKGETSQQSKNSKKSKTPKVYSTDPEILSLSNSSMSSLLSGDAVSGNFQTRLHPPAADLTFAGRFKSVGRLETFSNVITVQANGQKSTTSVIDTSIEVPTRPIYEDNNDSNTSCSRLSPYDELEPKLDQNRLKSCEETIPKKRGRKKGSKGVDSLIAKESSLSQQIFFGSGVKKVKTTKELFNEIQSRKLSTSFNRGENTTAPSVTNRILSTSSTNVRNLECRSLHTRPASSCSETSIHSPHALEPFSSNVSLAGTEKHSNTLEDPGNTDSDTVTSELSRDSKPRNKRIHSLDSNSNSHQQTSSAKSAEDVVMKTDYNDVRTQLMHIVRSLNSPLTVDETEKRYQAEIVPCTCIIFEDMPKESFEHNKLSQIGKESDLVNKGSSDIDISRDKRHNEQTAIKTENCVVDAAEQTIAQKPMKSIFDLDFDDDDDPLHTIIKHVSPTESNVKTKLDIDFDSTDSNVVSLAEEDINKDSKAEITDSFPADQESSNIIAEPISIYTVREDPKCIAKQRFDIQTNDVTNFHINALHNYYIPNINGNWNSIDSSLVLKSSSITEFLQTLESYTVTDGSDVVPKYGSLTYEQRIRKDLSYLKFVQNYKSKSFKSFMPPFLGVAKCLPTCRLAAKRLKDKTKSLPTINSANMLVKQEKSEMHCSYFANNSSGPNPLRVEVTINDTQKNNESQVRYSDDNPIKHNAELSYNLLKVVNSENHENFKKSDDSNAGYTNMKYRRYRRNSTCSSSNLQLTQDSINEKLRNQRAEYTEISEQSESNIERNRKKRRKRNNSTPYDKHNIKNLTIEEKPRIKRIKIAINGNVSTHRQISVISSGDISCGDEEEAHIEMSDMEVGFDNIGYSHYAPGASDDDHESNRSHSTTVDSILADDDHMENDDDNNSDDEEYAIVQRPLAHGGGSNNHIVLTIKKTPSKINSPANSISAISPIVGVATEVEMSTGKQQDAEIVTSNLSVESKCEAHGSESILCQTLLQ
ncbi:uncharacterized protein Dmoj_GI14059, isoform B [Drosophila mojavensis]|uniref:Mediator of RNA polymerase II transcription subunit 26 n=1 Tax=Drosophila mojavensis TaxID=7230 RepID=B4L7A0_DROMO|nr:uncharacterized protein Dmoj_GI14059, isoform C [Drosophila mojavensis]KRG07241.1 uncharacterized protein Dmoj_GI14059, isoform B [Drosophila mojavensis]